MKPLIAPAVIKGFIALPVMGWAAIAAGAVILALGVGLKVQTARLDSVKAEYSTFRTQVEALGMEAEKAAKKAELANQKAKEQANAKTKRLLADNAVLGKRLRDARASSSFVPPAAPGTRSPDSACFNRIELERAIQSLDAGVSALIAEGDGFGLRLSTAAEWAASISR